MIRDEIQIAAERDYAVREAREEARERALTEGIMTGRAEGIITGLARGKEEGKAEEKTETSRKLKQAGVAEEIISRCTGLSVEEIQAL